MMGWLRRFWERKHKTEVISHSTSLLVGPMTDEEYEIIIKEMTDRHLDLLAMNYLERNKRAWPKSSLENLSTSGMVVTRFEMTMIGNDVVQMLGAIRRRI